MAKRTKYQVIVGNIGTVYDGPSWSKAGAEYREYVQISRRGVGRAGGESVTFMRDGEIVQEHAGSNSGDHKRRRGKRHGNALTERRARIIRESSTRFEQSRERHDPKRYKRGGGYTPEEYKAIARKAGISRAPSNRAKGLLEQHNFRHNPPDHLFAYYDLKKGVITTWPGQKLGDIVWRGKIVRGLNGGQSLPIRMRGINGVMYHGRCNLTGGDYCKLRRMASTRTR